MEWLIYGIFVSMLFSKELLTHLETITFGQLWSMAYRPTEVFPDFFFDETTFKTPCPCNSNNKFPKYMAPQTTRITVDSMIPSLMDTHVQTMDIDIIGNLVLKNIFKHRLNHIPLHKTLLHEVVDTVFDAWYQVCQILQIDPFDQITWIRYEVWAILKKKASHNDVGFKYAQPSLNRIHPTMD